MGGGVQRHFFPLRAETPDPLPPLPRLAPHSVFGFITDLGLPSCSESWQLALGHACKEVREVAWTSFYVVDRPVGIWSAALSEEPWQDCLLSKMEVRFVVVTWQPEELLNVQIMSRVETGYEYWPEHDSDCPYYHGLERFPADLWHRCDTNPLVWFLPVPSYALERIVTKCVD